MSLSRRALSDIQWWNDNISSISKPLTFPGPSVHLYSDSSLTGWGAWITNGSAHSRSLLQTHGSWSAEQQQLHINVLELTAALYGLQARTGLLVDLDLGHRSTRQIGTVYRINPRFSDLKLYNIVQTSEFHPS